VIGSGPVRVPLADLPGLFAPGERLFLPGSSGAPTALVAAWLRDPATTRGLNITTSFVPGINALDVGALDPTCRVSGLFMQPEFRGAETAGRFRHLPVSYAGFDRLLRSGPMFDTCILQLAPPDENGQCSLGPAVEFAPSLLRSSRRCIGLINMRTPRVPGAWSLPHARLAAVCEVDTPLPLYHTGPAGAQGQRIAAQIASFIGDGATLQLGLGKVPQALLAALGDRRRLRLHSGMLPDAAMTLFDAGVFDPAWPGHMACAAVGTQPLYDWLRDDHNIRIAGCDVTHDAAVLAGLEGFVAVNAALEVDLRGQCNLEHVAGRAVSGAGGAPDFARAARNCPGGLSVVALPATFGRAGGSRIRARLGERAVTTLPRTDIDLVVTEHGVADLRARSVEERAEALIAIAEPGLRDDLRRDWRGGRES